MKYTYEEFKTRPHRQEWRKQAEAAQSKEVESSYFRGRLNALVKATAALRKLQNKITDLTQKIRGLCPHLLAHQYVLEIPGEDEYGSNDSLTQHHLWCKRCDTHLKEL